MVPITSSLSRRSFLAAPAGLATVPAVAADSAPASGLKLGVATYSLRRFERAQAIRMILELKARYVSIKEYHLPLSATRPQILAGRSDFDAAGLTVLSCGMIKFTEEDERDIRLKFEYARAAGIPMIVCGPTRATLPRLEKFVREFDIKIAVHNHGPEDRNFPTPQSALEVVRNMDPRCGLCIDCGHTACTGVDVVQAIREAGDRLFDVHMKDLRDIRDGDSWCDVGEGILPVPAIFRQLGRMGYRGGAMLEYEIHERDPLPGMRNSLAYMRGVIRGLENSQA